jgi:hypothetical protein
MGAKVGLLGDTGVSVVPVATGEADDPGAIGAGVKKGKVMGVRVGAIAMGMRVGAPGSAVATMGDCVG